MKEKKWRIEVTEHQLRLIANCVEDCHRFIAGQMELSNSTACLYLEHCRSLRTNLNELQPFVTPWLGRNENYVWDGSYCPNERQRKFIAETYYLYREIYHQITLDEPKYEDMDWNVYLSNTLTCEDSGEPIKVERMNDVC